MSRTVAFVVVLALWSALQLPAGQPPAKDKKSPEAAQEAKTATAAKKAADLQLQVTKAKTALAAAEATLAAHEAAEPIKPRTAAEKADRVEVIKKQVAANNNLANEAVRHTAALNREMYRLGALPPTHFPTLRPGRIEDHSAGSYVYVSATGRLVKEDEGGVWVVALSMQSGRDIEGKPLMAEVRLAVRGLPLVGVSAGAPVTVQGVLERDAPPPAGKPQVTTFKYIDPKSSDSK